MGSSIVSCCTGDSCIPSDLQKRRSSGKPFYNNTKLNEPCFDDIYDDFKFSDLKQINDGKYYSNVRNNNNRIISFKDLRWRPKLMASTDRGSQILNAISNSKAIHRLIKEYGWKINSLIEITLHSDINDEVDKYNEKNKCLGYNGMVSLMSESDCIALVVNNRSDKEIFHTFTHELAHMMNDTHNSHFYCAQQKIIKSILAYNMLL